MKKILSFLCALILLFTTFSGCGNKTPNTEQTLEIYLVELGYGSDWLQPMIDAFKEQDWVKETYPELIVVKQVNETSGYANTQLESNTSIDLLMSGRFSKTSLLYDITLDVYESTVPGEDVIYKEKIRDSYLDSFGDVKTYGDIPKYYASPWADGMMSILYNQDILDAANIAVPNTTDEFIVACEKLKTVAFEGRKDGFYPIAQGNDETYWDQLFPILWAQYDGVDGVDLFYNGVYNRQLSKNIFTNYLGRKYAVEFFEKVLDANKKYLNPKSLDTNNFKTTQYNFLRGYAAFNVNGDWFPSEMAGTIKNMNSQNYDVSTIKMMRVPIISQIVDRTPSIKMVAATKEISDDKMLSLIIEEIDEGKTISSYEGISQEDFDIVRKARGVVGTIGTNHYAAIPSYAVGKKVACDFLRFMATDEAIKIYMENTCGATLPFDMSYEAITSSDCYDSIDIIHKERIDYFYSDNLTLQILPALTKYPLVQYGGLMAFSNVEYYNKLSIPNRTYSAKKFFDDTVALWTDAKWDKALRDAGYKE